MRSTIGARRWAAGAESTSRSKWNCKEFEQESASLIEGVDKGKITWGYAGKNDSDIKHGIRVSDVKWLSSILDYVTDDHVSAALAAAGADAEETRIFVGAMRRRLEALKSLT